MLKKVKLNQLLPNPYRHFHRYPINEDKVEALIESIGATGFWGETVIARPRGPKCEIAFGHHRIEAARRALGDRAEVQISVRKLSDTQMFEMMCRENNEMYANVTADMDIETVAAGIEGFARGKIELPEPKPAGQRRTGNGLTPAQFGIGMYDGSSHMFTKEGLRKLIGMPHGRFSEALRALKLIAQNMMDAESYQGLKPDDAAALSRSVANVEKKAGKAAAKKAGKDIAKGIKSDRKIRGSGKHAGREIAKKVEQRAIEKVLGKQLLDISDYAKRVNTAVSNFLRDDSNAKDLDEIVKYADSLDVNRRNSLVSALEKLERRASEYREALISRRLQSVK